VHKKLCLRCRRRRVNELPQPGFLQHLDDLEACHEPHRQAPVWPGHENDAHGQQAEVELAGHSLDVTVLALP
jgi:hypothetical protein